jgi:methyl-accepting chemotaxis protein
MDGILHGLLATAPTEEEAPTGETGSLDGTTGWEDVQEGYIADGDVEVTDSLGLLSEASVGSILLSFLEGSEEAIFIIDAEGTFRYSNAACRDLFGREEGELLGDNLFAYDNADNEIVKQRVLGDGKPIRNRDEEIELDDGGVRYAERSVYPLFGAEGTTVGALEINRDVTEQVLGRRREEALLDYQSAAIGQLKSGLERLGQGDLTEEVSVPEPTAGTEFSEVQEARRRFEGMERDLNTAIRYIRETVKKVDEATGAVTDFADTLATTARDIEELAREIESASATVGEQSQAQSAEAERMLDIAEQLSASVEEISASTSDIRSQAVRTTDHVDASAEEATTAREVLGETTTAVEESVETMARLETEAETAHEMVAEVADIAEQTNMLALNASIEAARAADGSDGFAVVADEIKTLAEQAQEVSDRISGSLDAIEDLTSQATARVRENERNAESTMDAVDRIVAEIESVRAEAEATENGISEIDTATDDQADNTMQVRTSLEDVASVAKEIREDADTVRSRTERQVALSSDLTTRAAEFESIAADLEESLAQFTLDR